MNSEEALSILSADSNYKVLRRIEPRSVFSDKLGTKTCLIIDTETSGLLVDEGDVLIEVGAILVSYDETTGELCEVLETYESLEDPGFELSEDNVAVHGLTNADLEGKSFNEKDLELLSRDASIIVAHNSKFDRPFLEKRFPFFQGKLFGCSLKDVDWRGDGYPSSSLEVLAYKQGHFYDAHRALDDCHALASVLSSPMKDGVFPLSKIAQIAQEPRFVIGAYKSDFSTKNSLKGNGFYWDTTLRTWFKEVVGAAQAKELVAFLQREVYKTTKPVELQIKTLDPLRRFTNQNQTAEFVIRSLTAVDPDAPIIKDNQASLSFTPRAKSLPSFAKPNTPKF